MRDYPPFFDIDDKKKSASPLSNPLLLVPATCERGEVTQKEKS
jgi:hypothetical protein